MNTLGHAVQLVESLTLHHVAQQAACVALFVQPGHWIGHIQLGYGIQLGDDFARRGEGDAFLLGADGQGFDELQDVGGQRLCNAQRTQFHEDIDDLLFLRHGVNPADVAVGKERVFVPLGVGETQADVVGQLVVTQQQLQVGVHVAVVHIVRALPTQHVLGTLGQHTLEAHACHHGTNFVRINQAGVAEHLRRLAEHFLHLGSLAGHFFDEALFVDQ